MGGVTLLVLMVAVMTAVGVSLGHVGRRLFIQVQYLLLSTVTTLKISIKEPP